MDPKPTPVTDTKDGDPLQTKYYCQVEKGKHMKVIMEMKAKKHDNTERRPLRYVLVIDVSGSMANKTRHGNDTLLKRAQLFAELAVRKLEKYDYLSIVTFSNIAWIDLAMKKMTDENKLEAMDILRNLSTDEKTNLGDGLVKALEAIENAGQLQQGSRDCIILFTDGEPTCGVMDSETLIEIYRDKHRAMRTRSCVPLSAFTIGGYQPTILIEVAEQLGSESFYWLNDEKDFEVDILIPVFLRKITNISDVKVTIKARVDSHFTENKYSTQHLMRGNGYETKNSISYFIHSLPDEASKNLNFQVELPQNRDLDGLKIVDVEIDYLDENLRLRRIEDFIFLNMAPPMLKSNNQMVAAVSNVIPLGSLLSNFSAYVVENNRTCISQEVCEKVILKVAEQEFKTISISSITSTRDSMPGIDYFGKIDEVRNTCANLLSDSSESIEHLQRMLMTWKSIMKSANERNDNYALLSSMVASLLKECPTSDGVFEGNQPFMSDDMKYKLDEEKKNIEVARRIQSRPYIDIDELKRQAREAIQSGKQNDIEEYFKEFKELQLSGYKVENTYISYLQEEFKHRYVLENLKRDLRTSLPRHDFEKIAELLTKMKAMKRKQNLTFTRDDENTLQNSLKQIIDRIDQILTTSLKPQQLDVLRDAVKWMEFAKSEAETYREFEFFGPSNEANLRTARETLKIHEMQKIKIQNVLSQNVPQLRLAMHPANYAQIDSGIQAMDGIAAIANDFSLYQKEYAELLDEAILNRDVLKNRKEQIEQELDSLEPSFSMIPVPENLIPMREAVEKMNSLKDASGGFENLFTSTHETYLFEMTTNLNYLSVKIEELEIARRHLKEAETSRSYKSLKSVIKKAYKTTFIDKKELRAPRKRLSFLKPENRRRAVSDAMEQGEIDSLEEALVDMREVGIEDSELENQAEETLKSLRKQQRKEERDAKRRAIAKKRRKKEIKRLRNELSAAIDSNRIEKLEHALDEFEDSGFSETKIPNAIEAKDLLNFLKIQELKIQIDTAVRERSFKLLQDALIAVDHGNYRTHLKEEYKIAKELLLYIKEMMRLQDTIAKMTRSSISEVHNFPRPPKQVKRVMMSVFAILGEPAKELKDWLHIQTLLGKLDRNSITKRVLRFKLRDLSIEDAEKADAYLGNFRLEDIEEISTVAATFYAWAKYTINETKFLHNERDKKQHETEEAEREEDQESLESDGEKYNSDVSSNEQNIA